MNSDKYIDINERKVIPNIRRVFLYDEGIFQQDLAPCHSSRKVKAIFRKHKLNVSKRPGNSLDLNLIKNVWAIAKSRLQILDCATTTKLIEANIQVWYRDPKIKENCQTLVESMRN